jgi:Flp pilus assembly protein CpaB
MDMGRRTLLLIVSIIVAATGTGVVALYARNADVRSANSNALTTVAVALQDIPVGTSLREARDRGWIGTDKRRNSDIPDKPVLDLKSLDLTQTVTSQIFKKDILQASMFAGATQSASSNVVGLTPKNEDGADLVALSVNVADVDRVAGYVVPGSYVGLIVTVGNQDSGNTVSHFLFDKPVKVLKVAAYQAASPTAGTTLVSLELTENQASVVVAAAANAKFTLVYVADPKVTLDITFQASAKTLASGLTTAR